MPKVHFFKLAQELGERPEKLQKRLIAQGIAEVRSTSTMLDEETAKKIREFLRQEAAAAAAQAAAQPAAAPAPAALPTPTEAPAATSTPAPAPAPAPAEETAPAPPRAPEEPRQPVTRVIKRTPETDGKLEVRPEARASAPAAPAKPAAPSTPTRPAAGPAPRAEGQPGRVEGPQPGKSTQAPPPHKGADGHPPKTKKVRPNLLITPENDGGLSPDAEFGIVKAAGIVPLPAPRPPRPPRQDQRPGGPQEGGPRPQGPRPEGGRPPREGGRPGGPGFAQPTEVPGAPKPGAKPGGGPARPGDAKKKQKRTIFTDKDKERGGTRPQRGGFASTVMRSRRKRRGTGGRISEQEAASFDEPIIITGPVTVGELAEMAHATPAQIITQLIGMGVLATVNQLIEPEQAVTALEKLGIEAMFERDMVEHADWRLTSTTEYGLVGELRPPVVTILGHVDHGKTTLLDSIRKTNVTAQEFGGITQHIGAYQVVINEQKITFLDTPGHAAFTAMRARGANLTDIAVLVVAADDGIQPQTIEAIDHAKAAHVPIIVAINKVDLPDAQPDVVKQQLTSYGLVAEEWGGETILVPVSAKKGMGIEQLLEMILLQAEVLELRTEADKPARGAVVESKLDKQRGPVATILVQEGTLHVGDALTIGMVSGKIRAMTDDKGKPIREAGPSTPVEITGISDVPVAGDLFEVVDSERKAREIAETRQMKAREERLQAHVSLQNLSNMVATGQVRDLNVILKSDVAGSIEAISHAVGQVEHEEIRVNIIHAGVGDITESDVLLASASQAIIIGFHVKVEPQARFIAEEASIDVRIYQIIYDLVDDIQKAMLGLLAPIFEEAVLGHAEVRAVFNISRLGTVAGCYITDGLVRRGAKVRVKRAGEVVYEGTLDSLKHLKEDTRELAQGYECGISIDRFSAWQEGDIIESYVVKELRRETL